MERPYSAPTTAHLFMFIHCRSSITAPDVLHICLPTRILSEDQINWPCNVFSTANTVVQQTLSIPWINNNIQYYDLSPVWCVPSKFMCLNTWSPVGNIIWGGNGTYRGGKHGFQRWTIATHFISPLLPGCHHVPSRCHILSLLKP